MLPDRVSNPGPMTYESGALPIALRGLASAGSKNQHTSLKPVKNTLLKFHDDIFAFRLANHFCFER